MPGSRSRRKGQVGEREAAAELRRLFDIDACRGRQQRGGPDSPDIIHGIPGVHFEVKRAERLRLYPAMSQASEEAGDKIPVVLYRANEAPWLVIVRLDDLPKLAVQLYLAIADSEEGETDAISES